MKEVSVIVPCYNCASFVGDTLESLASQTYKNFEVVCINDGSQDETLSVLQQWKERNLLDMQIISQQNGGVSRARNAGIRAAQGKYLLFLDADDLYHPTYIQRLCETMQNSDADVVYCWLSRNPEVLSSEYHTVPVICQNQEEAMRNLLYRMPEIGFYCYLYRKDWIVRENLEFDVNTRHFEDREFNWKYLCHCQSAVLVDAPLYYYRVNVNSVTQNRKTQWRTEGTDAVHRIEAYMEQVKCPFLDELKDYLFSRVIWSSAKRYALGGERALLKRLGKEYDVKTCMKRTARDSNKLVALASWCYLIHPSLFYYVVRLKK